MIPNPRCPACDDDAWRECGSARFVRDAAGRTPYEQLRDRVTFELWAPGAHELTLSFACCDGCGFVTYLPRPSVADVDAKYALISAHEAPAKRDERLDAVRSQALCRWASAHLPNVGGTLLDLGGGRGELLPAFVAAGFRCAVVDFARDAIPGVERCGNTLADVPEGRVFETVLASHVFEHLADPFATARDVFERLAPGGSLLLEVPLEILGGPPRMREPVTHVSFFCESSLSALLRRAGFEIVHAETLASLFASGAYRYAVRVVARRPAHAERAVEPARPGAAEARALLTAGPLAKAVRALRAPKVLLPKRSFRAA